MTGRIVAVCVFTLSVCAWQLVSSDGAARLDVFHAVLEEHGLEGATHLTPAKLEEYLDAVVDRFTCKQNGAAIVGLETETSTGTCPENLCVDSAGLITIAGGDQTAGLAEEQFHSASMVLLYLLSKGQHPCGATLDPSAGSLTLASVRTGLAGSVSGDGQLSEDGIETFLHGLEGVYEGIEHGHDEEHDGDGDGDDHGDHGHERKKRSGDDHDDHDDHGHDEEEKARVMEAKCLSPDAVLYYMNVEEEPTVDAASNIEDFATIVVYLMSEASAIEESCRELPSKRQLLDDFIYRLTGERGVNVSQAVLTELLELLGIVPTTEGEEDDHSGHAHARRRRSAGTDPRALLSRVRRQASAPQDAKCLSQAELNAIYDLTGSLTPDQLTQLSPALIYQKLYAQCVIESHSETSSLKWLYGILAVFIVCLCSLFGVLLVPCMNTSVYRLGLALFVGLAIGTLIGDALLHLIPVAMGAHGEHGGHSHAEGPVVVEDYVWFALVILAGIYGFYLLEAVFMRFMGGQVRRGSISPESSSATGTTDSGHGHSHDMELNVTPDGKGMPYSTEEKAPAKSTTNNALTVMIVLGDAVHNFADGLAIGAAFSSSNAVGVATSIAVFCHELPHELGDFAVLLKNGLTVCRAMLWNVVSSLTAFVGVLIGLGVATDSSVQTWIFAVAAGMFLYIAMTDLMPQVTTREACQDTPVFLLNNLGMLLGIFIMLLIAIFEERIVID